MNKKVFLLDAMALIYRAHFAFSKNPRINSKGFNTSAVYGFVNTMYEIIRKEKPAYLGVGFDLPGPTFRHHDFEAYKANRDKQPEDITSAIPIIKDILAAFNIPILAKEGFEADDVIGTVAKQLGKEGLEVYMMTPDKDYAQLVEDNIFLYKPAMMGKGIEIYGVEEVLKKWNIQRVDQVIDILGLQGDSVDNIPGVPGIGPKTAQKLLLQYDSVEGILEHTHELKGKQKERFENFADQAILSKQLATIVIDVPVDIKAEDLLLGDYNEDTLYQIFTELEFKTLGKRILGREINVGPVGTTKKSSNSMEISEDYTDTNPSSLQERIRRNIHNQITQYHFIDTLEEVQNLVPYLLEQTEVCFDTETDNINAYEAQLVGIALSYRKGEAFYINCNKGKKELEDILNCLKPFFQAEKITKIAQNIKYDRMVLLNHGIELGGPIFDTMLAHYLIAPDSRHGMDLLADKYLAYDTIPIESLIGKKGKKQLSMRDIPAHKITDYACEDADITLQLYYIFKEQIEQMELQALLFDVEHPLEEVLAQVERNGVAIDPQILGDLSNAIADDCLQLETRIFTAADERFNISSPKQLGEILFGKLQLMEKPKKTKSGQYATGEEILIKLAKKHDIVADILSFRQLNKLKNTYIDTLPGLQSPKDNLLHTSYNQAVAATGRLSSTNPNLQNIPIKRERGREIRKAFIPRDENHILLAADYSQIELRIMAAFSQDEHMVEAFQNKRDIHTATASKIYKVSEAEVTPDMRRKAKTANFGIIYGISAFGLSERLNIPRREASDIIKAYFEEFPRVKSYMNECIAKAEEKGYVSTLLGRRRYLHDINSANKTLKSFAERNAINAPIQGSAADLIKIAMINLHKWMEQEQVKSKMIMQVHDELVFDVHKDELELMKAKIKELMEDAYDIGLPLEVEVGMGQNWLEAH